MKPVVRAANVGARKAWLWRNRHKFGRAVHSERRRLLVDVSAILGHDAQTGIQRVVRAVWSELKGHGRSDLEILPVYATRTRGYCFAPIDVFERKHGGYASQAVSVRPGDKFLGLDLSAHLLPSYRQQLRAWRAFGATVHLVIYDLLPLQQPDWFNSAAVNHFRRWFDVSVRDADQAICISDQVGSDVRERLSRFSSERRPTIGRLHMGSDIAATMPSQGLCGNTRRLLERIRFRPAILMVGTIEPRKGYDAAIAAFEHLWRTREAEAPDLVIIGKGGWKTAALQQYVRTHPEQGKRLHWLDSVSDEGLCLFYDACRAVFMASRGEGFGLPLVEAAVHGRRVLARDLPVFREQSAEGVSYFSDDEPAALGEKLMELMKPHHHLTSALSFPTWSESVERLLVEMGYETMKEREIRHALRVAS
jgi:glycosyltransferase involved in cell wall biosynthesis